MLQYKYNDRKVEQTMEKTVLEFVTEKTNDLIAAPSCSAEAKAAAEAWLASDKGLDANKAYIAELEADIMPIDGLIAFAESAAAAQVFGGEEAAKGVAQHAHDLKAAGRKYCDCPACAACEAILEKKDAMLG